jgi:diguanylate cyclase (GGDEF)-like protein
LLDRFVNLHRAYEELNGSLEEKVTERTREIEELNESLKHIADHDDLTGAYNRRFFNEYFEFELKRVKNYLDYKARLPYQENEMNFGLAILDVDHFKEINDTYGHLVGDSVLKQIIAIIQENIFTRDVLCRYGGDEFALLLTKTSSEGIHQALEKIKKEVEEHAFVIDPEHPGRQITISAGLVNFSEVRDRDGLEALKLADDRLLRAKTSGRNRIIYDDLEG